MKPVVRNGLIAAGLLVAALGTVLYLGGYELRRTPPATQKAPSDPALAARGAYLARAGDCMACHTARGGAAYAGGRAIATPFGRIVAPNITPDRTGIGAGRRRFLARAAQRQIARRPPAVSGLPYTNYTRVTRADADALHAYCAACRP
jgi:mono/diheme cytochrome c family protein